jgi:hypothetical protein
MFIIGIIIFLLQLLQPVASIFKKTSGGFTHNQLNWHTDLGNNSRFQELDQVLSQQLPCQRDILPDGSQGQLVVGSD